MSTPAKSESGTQKPRLHTPQWVSLVAGGVAGGVEAAITYPFEYSKTRVQLLNDSAIRTSNPLSLIVQVARQEGVGALYTGCSTLVIGTTAKAAVRFVSYDTIRNSLADDRGVLSAGRGMLAGMTAGAVESVLAVTPTERIKTALIDDAKGARQFKSSIHAIQVLVQRHGIAELYRGLVSTMMKQSATSAVRMGTYNVLKEATKARGIKANVFTTFGIGALAGVVTVYATQPFDTIKTRAQGVQGAGIVEASRSVIRDYGIRGFWKGSSMRLGRLLLSGGIVFSVYEEVAAILSPGTHR
ncbi:Mitochondrial carrier protein [Penicillium expansum]|uniref:Mitochondrial carrier protein n=1 Tax=Penicillium expansum TaxID=27334 RepID=A0A0A2I3W4_PENEN|nr:Mitochondrial carrier protein [Penicillium expansum]KGO37086.1 Mitochondrial carrier protein [Penicillium expansum]KGO46868.1 Mitochondrial carrier protein [Penicillium expansum]KGO62364.1 Mitochondrial carrier protein [Penicillium expansum]